MALPTYVASQCRSLYFWYFVYTILLLSFESIYAIEVPSEKFMTSSWTLKPVTFPIPPEIQVPHIPQRNGRVHRFPGIHENATPQIDYDYDFSPRSIVFAPDDSCIARLVEPLNIVLNTFSTTCPLTLPASISMGVKPNQNESRAGGDVAPINKTIGNTMSDMTITLGPNKIIRCPEGITAMTFGPEQKLKTYCRTYHSEEQHKDNHTTDLPSSFVLVTGHKNGTIRFWDTQTCRLITTLSSHKGQINALVFSSKTTEQAQDDGNQNISLQLISVANDLTLKVWDSEYYGYNMSQSISHNQPLWCCDYSPNGKLVAAAGTGRCIFIYDTASSHSPKNMELRLRLQGHLSNIVGCKFSPNSALLVTASWDTKVNIWDSYSGELKQSLCHTVPSPQLVFSPHIRALSINKFFTAISTGVLQKRPQAIII